MLHGHQYSYHFHVQTPFNILFNILQINDMTVTAVTQTHPTTQRYKERGIFSATASCRNVLRTAATKIKESPKVPTIYRPTEWSTPPRPKSKEYEHPAIDWMEGIEAKPSDFDDMDKIDEHAFAQEIERFLRKFKDRKKEDINSPLDVGSSLTASEPIYFDPDSLVYTSHETSSPEVSLEATCYRFDSESTESDFESGGEDIELLRRVFTSWHLQVQRFPKKRSSMQMKRLRLAFTLWSLQVRRVDARV